MGALDGGSDQPDDVPIPGDAGDLCPWHLPEERLPFARLAGKQGGTGLRLPDLRRCPVSEAPGPPASSAPEDGFWGGPVSAGPSVSGMIEEWSVSSGVISEMISSIKYLSIREAHVVLRLRARARDSGSGHPVVRINVGCLVIVPL